MLSIIIILSIALAIFLGYRTKINTGLFCIVFAYIIGCFVMGLKPKQIIGFWPTSTMFVILSVSLFSGTSALCAVCSSSHPFSYGSYFFHRSCIFSSDHSGDLR